MVPIVTVKLDWDWVASAGFSSLTGSSNIALSAVSAFPAQNGKQLCQLHGFLYSKVRTDRPHYTVIFLPLLRGIFLLTLTRVPNFEEWSTRKSPSDRTWMLAWCLETVMSSIRISEVRARPTLTFLVEEKSTTIIDLTSSLWPSIFSRIK